MSDPTASNSGNHAGDPLAPDVIEYSIARSLRPDAPETPTTVLVRGLADAYTLPPAAEAILVRGRATLARLAEAQGAGGLHMRSSDTWPAVTIPNATPNTPPTLPPRRPRSPFGMAWRTAAAVLVVALMSAGFYGLLNGMTQLNGHPTPTRSPTSATTSPSATPRVTPQHIPPQPPAPAGVYITGAGTLFRIDLSTGAIQSRFPPPLSSQAYLGAPVEGNGMIYFTAATTASPRASDVVAVSATSGALLWHEQTAGTLTQLSLVGDILYGGTNGTSTGSDTFYALRASDGSVLWTFHTATLRASAVISDGVVYLADQPQNTPLQHMRALRAFDGSQLWDTALPQACGIELFQSVDQGMVFVACGAAFDTGQGGDGVVYGLSASDGAIRWHSSTNGQPYTMAAGAGLVYVSRGGKNAAGTNVTGLDALDEASGALRWQAANGGGWPTINGTTVYASVGSSLAAFSAADGTVLWTYPEANQRIELTMPVIAAGVVYQILNEQVLAISADHGTVLWRSPTLVTQQLGVGGLTVVTGG